ncbi:hypothetical protein RKE29_06955 [Streptomyces sp. B1866]|uniref:hypothetical protein n=1 Tax=Streptomyces sp. B1866 TaxID=3075431 RepID=UPI00289237C5|nr:hypothetical protein [Streptomyces sp. B1866]MDT3396380.1 hypothetical protein [Streptomyces sp. B1866]
MAVIIDGFECRAVAQTPDRSREFCLGAYRADTAGEAVAWLRGQAARFARGLDPRPDEGWAPRGALLALPGGLPGPAQLMRSWERDGQAHADIVRYLWAGFHFSLLT